MILQDFSLEFFQQGLQLWHHWASDHLSFGSPVKLRLIFLQHHHPVHIKMVWEKCRLQGEGKVMNLFFTSLRWLRASSPAIFRPPFTQIWVINLFPILWARLRISIKSVGDKLKFGLLTIFPCSQPDFMKATAVPQGCRCSEATRKGASAQSRKKEPT